MADEEVPTEVKDESLSTESNEEPAELKNTVAVEDAGPCRKKLTIEVPAAKIKKVTEEQYETLRKEALVPGFRKGRAPRRLLEKRFGKDTATQVKLKLIADASEAAIKESELQTIGDPEIDVEKTELPAEGPMKFEFEVEIRPQFDLPQLEGIPVTRTKLEVTDEQVDREIEQMCRWAGVWTPRPEQSAAELDDQIVADVVLKVDGIEEERKLNNIEIYVRPNGFVGEVPVEKLDELLVGAKVADVKQTSTEVSKAFFREEYRGKKVDIQIDIQDIKWLKPAEVDEGLLKRYGVETQEELRDRIQDTLQSRLESQGRAEMTEQIYQHLLDNTDFDLPLDVVAQQAGTVLQRQYTSLLMRGLSREQIAEQVEQLQATSEQQAKQQLKTFFIMDKVAEKLDVSVSEEEINGHIAQLAMRRQQRPERLREEMMRDGSLAQFSLEVRQDKCIAKLLETAKITETEAKPKAPKTKKAAKPARKPTKKSDKKTEKKAAESEDAEA